MSRWHWVKHEGQELRDIGVDDDGAVHNPRGYPEDLVRAAVSAAEKRVKERLSESAKRAAETRRKRTERKVYEAARRLVEGHEIGPRTGCAICGRGLGDQQSIQRGIGSECWQDVLTAIQRHSRPA
jgi:hypothetical protein